MSSPLFISIGFSFSPFAPPSPENECETSFHSYPICWVFTFRLIDHSLKFSWNLFALLTRLLSPFTNSWLTIKALLTRRVYSSLLSRGSITLKACVLSWRISLGREAIVSLGRSHLEASNWAYIFSFFLSRAILALQKSYSAWVWRLKT